VSSPLGNATISAPDSTSGDSNNEKKTNKLDKLTPRRRAIVVMHELEGLAIPAIASLLGISAITVRWHLSLGRRDLARDLGSP